MPNHTITAFRPAVSPRGGAAGFFVLTEKIVAAKMENPFKYERKYGIITAKRILYLTDGPTPRTAGMPIIP